MLRKLLLATAACTAFAAVGPLAQTASAAHSLCAGMGGAGTLATGIYPSNAPTAGNIGTFQLDNTGGPPPRALRVDGFTGGAVLCSPTVVGQLYLEGRVITPGQGEQIHCASANFTTCPRHAGGGQPLPDSSYYGSATVDSYCTSALCALSRNIDNIPATIRVNYSAPGCSSHALVCTEATATPIPGVTCKSTTLVERTLAEIPRPAYALVIKQPNCTLIGQQVYFTQIKLNLCAYAGTPQGSGNNACGNGSSASEWQQRNGRTGTWNYTVRTVNTGMPAQYAVAPLTW